MKRLFLCLAMLLALAACGDNKWASEEAVARARYVSNQPPSLTLFTVLNNRSGSGAHTGLLINASQRVMFDPAGTWHHPALPERSDVHYGITDKMVAFYIDYHARVTYRVVEQTLPVTAAQAEAALQIAQNHGSAAKAMCAQSVSTILRQVPGLEGLPRTWEPKKLMTAFGKLPGVTERVITDVDADHNHGVLLVQAAEAPL